MERTERLMQALAEVQDPELPLSIVDLGLVCGLHAQGERVTVELTLTSTGCPCVDWICEDIRRRLLEEPDVKAVDVQLVWCRPWTPRNLTARGRRALRASGYAVPDPDGREQEEL